MIKKNSCVCVCVHHFIGKEERTGLILCATPTRSPKGGLRLSDYGQRLSDLLLGGGI